LALGVRRLRAEHWARLEAAAAGYLRQRDQDNAAPTRAAQKAALTEIAEMASALIGRLAALDDHARLPPTDDAIAILLDLDAEARAQIANIGETRGARRQLDSLSILVADLAHVWTIVTGEAITLDRIKTSGGYVPNSPSANFIISVVNTVDRNVSQRRSQQSSPMLDSLLLKSGTPAFGCFKLQGFDLTP
jgi:hypothetical protein